MAVGRKQQLCRNLQVSIFWDAVSVRRSRGGVAGVRSDKDAKGLMQLIDSTATALGVRNVWDPAQNINGGTRYLSSLLAKFGGNVEQAVASYNAGPAAVEKYGGVPPYRETRAYVERVMNYLQYFQGREGGTHEEE